jgi:DNA gyrase subunit A
LAFFFLEIIAHYQYVLSNTSVMVNPEDEPILVTNQGIIIRQAADAIPTQSRNATGVRVQRLNEDDAIAAVAVVLLSAQAEEVLEEQVTEFVPRTKISAKRATKVYL